jgi:hypothetical protein
MRGLVGVKQEFNFSGVIQSAVDEIQENKDNLSVTQDVGNSTAALQRALSLLDLDLQKDYNSQLYKDTFNNIIANADRYVRRTKLIIEQYYGPEEAQIILHASQLGVV